MEMVNQRINGGINCTIGQLYIDCHFGCFTLEDEFRSTKVKGKTRIPAGRYRITLRTQGGFHERYRKRFGDLHKGMLWVRDVPGFEYILIHCGNTHEHTDGCLLVGDTLKANTGGRDGSLSESEVAYRRIYPIIRDALINGDDVWITYRDEGQLQLS